MAKGNSNPLLPFNAKFGLGYDLKIWDSYSKFPFPRTLKDSYVNWLKFRRPLVSYNLNLALHHYSNGQSDLNPEVNANGRNNYITGNFSTNYFRAMIYRTKLGWKEDNNGYGTRDLLTLGLGYQADGQVGDESVFDYANSQDKRYGYNRLLGTVILKKNYRVKRIKGWAVQQNAEPNCDCKKLNLGVHSRHEWTLRTDLEYITDGDLSKYINIQNEKNRLAFSTMLNFTTYRFRTVGLFVKYYYGRDYLNIRYDDKIKSLIFGLTFAFDKYKEPLLAGDFIAKKQRDPLKIIGCTDVDCR